MDNGNFGAPVTNQAFKQRITLHAPTTNLQNRKTKLTYDLYQRAWIKRNGSDAVHDFIHAYCELLFNYSCSLDHDAIDGDLWWDLNSPLSFEEYNISTYPVNGYESIFFKMQGTHERDKHRSRIFSVRQCGFRANPEYLPPTATFRNPNQEREALFGFGWGFQVKHEFENSTPTNRFSYSIDAFALELDDGYLNLIGRLGFDVVYIKDVKKMDVFKEFMAATKGAGVGAEWAICSQQQDSSSRKWRGFIDVKIDGGIFGRYAERTIFLE